MNIIEAFKTGKPVRRKKKAFNYQSQDFLSDTITYIMPDAWIDPKFFLQVIRLKEEDILAKDWEVKRK